MCHCNYHLFGLYTILNKGNISIYAHNSILVEHVANLSDQLIRKFDHLRGKSVWSVRKFNHLWNPKWSDRWVKRQASNLGKLDSVFINLVDYKANVPLIVIMYCSLQLHVLKCNLARGLHENGKKLLEMIYINKLMPVDGVTWHHSSSGKSFTL